MPKLSQTIEKKIRAVEYKGGCCERCGYDKYYGALQFHHRNPNTKDAAWSELRKRTWTAIKKEIDKCDLLCANCHAEVHEELRQKKRFPKREEFKYCRETGEVCYDPVCASTKDFCLSKDFYEWTKRDNKEGEDK